MQVLAKQRTLGFKFDGQVYTLEPGVYRTLPDDLAKQDDFKFAKEHGELDVLPDPVAREESSAPAKSASDKAKTKE